MHAMEYWVGFIGETTPIPDIVSKPPREKWGIALVIVWI